VVITSPTKEAVIGDALRSVLPFAGTILVIHCTGIGALVGQPDGTMDVVAATVPADRLIVQHRNVGRWDMAELRNEGLEAASADWAVMLDTDTRILPNGRDIRAMLAGLAPDIDAVAVMEDTGNYDKELFFRLPVKGAYRMGCHEEYTTPGKTTLAPGVRFHELKKSSEQLKEYHAAQLVAMQEQILADPANPRWHFYLGLILELQERYAEAITAYTESLACPKNSGGLGWSCYRIAVCHRALRAYAEGVHACLDSLYHEPSSAEPYWMAGLCCHYQGLHYQAIAWELSAIAHSWRGRCNAATTRFGFKYTPALYEAPYEVLAASYACLGDRAKETWAAAEIQLARREREKFFAQGL
jgi:tetratricopeptide (TPR) repeat protein